jgi:hypothetical protein
LGIQNDDDYVYFLVRLQGQIAAQQFLRSGLTVRLKGVGKENAGLGYKFKSSNPQMGAMGQMGQMGQMTPPPKFDRNQSPKQMNGFNPPELPASGVFTAVRTIDDIEDLYYGSNSDNGPQGAFVNEKGICSFEFRIPLTDMGDEPLWNDSRFKGKIRLQFESAGSGQFAGGGKGGGPGGGGMGGGPGGGGPGGGPGGGGGTDDGGGGPGGMGGGGFGGGPGGGPGGGGMGGMPGGGPNMQKVKQIKLEILVNLAGKQ